MPEETYVNQEMFPKFVAPRDTLSALISIGKQNEQMGNSLIRIEALLTQLITGNTSEEEEKSLLEEVSDIAADLKDDGKRNYSNRSKRK